MLRRQVFLLAALALAACQPTGPAKVEAQGPGQGQPVATAPVDAESQKLLTELDQRWTPDNRQVWYETSQGSRLIPLSWLLALEDADGKPLLTDENVKRWGYLPHVNRQGRPLPIGFTEDVTPDAQLPKPLITWRAQPKPDDRIWVGMNCAACHTAQMTYQGRTLTVDGGPALSDFEGFTKALYDALKATDADDARFGRFADRVLRDKPLDPWKPGLDPVAAIKDLVTKGPEDDPQDRGRLHAALKRVLARETELRRLSDIPGTPDYGRLDAFGHIFNKVAWMVETPNMAPPQDVNRTNAPVSYPFLWNVPQHDKVQWNGVAPKLTIQGEDVGALIRNAGEVIGVFADIQVAQGQLGYPSSVNVAGLKTLEAQLLVLRPPAWPATVLGWNTTAVDDDGKPVTHEQLVAHGRDIYLRGTPKAGNCVGCHKLLPDRADVKTPIVAQMAMLNPKTKVAGAIHESAGTDIWMACNAYAKNAYSGWMQGVPTGLFTFMGPRADLSEMTKVAVVGALLRQGKPIAGSFQNSALEMKKPPKPEPAAAAAAVAPGLAPSAVSTPLKVPTEDLCLKAVDPTLGYKGRPLNGVWATAPYLHNGSVRTLFQLLLPPDQREASFEVGNREFDPKEVGYVSATTANHSTLTARAAGKPVPGSSNAGHDYGNAGLSAYDRWALVEYLKTL